jgi:hypothetical protein
MLEVNKNNSKAIPKSSSIKLTKATGFVISSLNFKHVVMANYNALENNQQLLNWFKTQVVTNRRYKIHNYLRDVPKEKKEHSSTYFDSILPTIIKNSILELQCFLKHNDFIGKFANKFQIPMLEDLIRTNQ